MKDRIYFSVLIFVQEKLIKSTIKDRSNFEKFSYTDNVRKLIVFWINCPAFSIWDSPIFKRPFLLLNQLKAEIKSGRICTVSIF